MGYAPHHRPIGQSLPPRGSHEVAEHFCRIFFPRENEAGGSLGTRLTIFAEFCGSKNKARESLMGEALWGKNQSAL